MSVASYIVIALAFGLVNMLLFRRCAEATPIRLSAGLLVTFGTAAVHTLLFWLGTLLGGLLRLESPVDPYLYADYNAYIFLGIVIVVVVKMLAPYLRREPRIPVFSLADTRAVLALAVASGINVLLVGVGAGFVQQASVPHRIIWPMLIFSFLFAYLGLMFGRQKVQLRPRRWMILASVLLIAAAIAAVVNA